MTAAENSTRTNAAGEKYSLRGIYGSEPYWPEAKLKICVTGAGGFIGASPSFSFFLLGVGGRADLSRSFGFFFSSEGLAETPPPPPRVFFGDVSKLARLVEKEGGRKTIKASSLAVVVVVVFSLDRKCWKMTTIITHTKTRADD